MSAALRKQALAGSKHANRVRWTAVPPPHGRRGSALILVVMLLGVIFVTGVAFMATMNFEARLVAIELEARQDDAAVEVVTSLINSAMRNALISTPGRPGGTQPLGEPVLVPDPRGGPALRAFRPAALTWAELPLVHGWISQVEPEWYWDPIALQTKLVYRYPTDLRLLLNGPTASSIYSNVRYIDVTRKNDTPAASYLPLAGTTTRYDPKTPMVADADGDGIVDSFLVNLEDLGFSRAQLAQLASVVNDPSNPGGGVFVGIRVIPHGAMVNLAEAHPNLIDNVMRLGVDYAGRPDAGNSFTAAWSERPDAYSPLVEEASLRRRFMLAPYGLPPTALQGNPYPVLPSTGDFGEHLFVPGDLGLIRDKRHRYWPYLPDQVGEVWAITMDPASGPHYDRRHLVTTVSHDDLLSRGAEVRIGHIEIDPATGREIVVTDREGDVLDLMREANIPPAGSAVPPACAVVFEYPDYPQDMPNTTSDATWCLCKDDRNCNVRKGRLRLSLPWLDKIDADLRELLIHDAFTMMLLTARDPAWGAFDDDGEWNVLSSQLDKVSLAAASLTANLLDFADEDDRPTRVELRSVDFSDPANVGRSLNPPQFVYGLERHLYITEVAAIVEDDGTGLPNPSQSSYAIELFNPYDEDIETHPLNSNDLDYVIRVVDANGQTRDQIGGNDFPDRRVGGNRPFLVLINESQNRAFPPDTVTAQSREPAAFSFQPNDTIYLLLDVQYPNPTGRKLIVVDQFKVTGPNIAEPKPPNLQGIVPVFSLVRPGVSPDDPYDRWFAPVPASVETPTPSLGSGNSSAPVDLKPVQVLLANTGPLLSDAFPTTGSLLLLMRHSNRSMDDLGVDPEFAAFTTHLAGTDTNSRGDLVVRQEQIDNGRMPVFDVGGVYHFDPACDPAVDPACDPVCDPAVDPNCASTVNRPGELHHLPWGQLVFDYFTALPLSNPGPWVNPDPTGNPNYAVPADAQPRVDQDGLRVHGRINLNAAPWTVLAGLPLVPMENIPGALRDAIRAGAGINVSDAEAAPLGPELAKAIVAYREARSIDTDRSGLVPPLPAAKTGDYGDASDGRGWSTAVPAARRGTGFLTVGELANARHPDATVDGLGTLPYFSFYRFDGGIIENSGAVREDYLSAVALLVALSDWVTVRSHVFTIYGVLRGEQSALPLQSDPIDLDARALRFQETVDRLPTFVGAPAPVRIGERTVGRYQDIRND